MGQIVALKCGMGDINPSSSTPPPLSAARGRPLSQAARIGVIVAVLGVVATALVGLTVHSILSGSDASGSDASAPTAANAQILANLGERAAAMKAEQDRDAETELQEKWKAQAAASAKKDREVEAELNEKWKAQEKAGAERDKRAKAIVKAEATRVAVAKEKEFAAWKAKRKTGMQQAAAKLRPEQVQSWNEATAAWNKLSLAQREARFRQEYLQLAAAPTGGADLSKPCISDADWERATRYRPQTTAATIPGLGNFQASPTIDYQAAQQAAAAAETARQQAAAAQAQAQATQGQVQATQATPAANREQHSEVDLTNTDGIFTLPVRLNGVVTKTFILDTGASAVKISGEVYRALVQNQTIDASDALGPVDTTQADGTTRELQRVRLRSVVIGNVVCEDVVAAIGGEGEPLLLGGSCLRQFKHTGIDNQRNKLILTY